MGPRRSRNRSRSRRRDRTTRSLIKRSCADETAGSVLGAEPDRAGDAGAAEAAVAVGHLGQVLLVVVLGVVELAELGDLGRDRPVARAVQALAERGLGGRGDGRLLG